ncbi:MULTISPECIES: hypothetical protein [unclassified Micromonospora]|uniref:hypothetical protein n=1 Tax=unclassified Micromonospora TaxID=2617518 RepID=UPI0020B27AE5|nr:MULTISPECIES: hypothetical protein [unclassified Micromonospora]MDM4784385.1 hypothetical protein [Micromonospora sp. b486]
MVFWALLVTALLAATGRAHRLLGWTVFALYFEWMIVAMSYGKVDHDRFALLVALAGAAHRPAVPGTATRSVPRRAAGRCGSPRSRSSARNFLAAWAKFRFGVGRANGSVLARAIIRRGTDLADLTRRCRTC